MTYNRYYWVNVALNQLQGFSLALLLFQPFKYAMLFAVTGFTVNIIGHIVLARKKVLLP